MILDSSAIVAVLCREAGYKGLLEQMNSAPIVAIGAPTLFETAMVLTIKLKRDGLALVNDFLRESSAVVIPFTEQHSSMAFRAYLRYGKGRHSAALNFGDCLTYAAAKVSGELLLYVGNDFDKTDVRSA